MIIRMTSSRVVVSGGYGALQAGNRRDGMVEDFSPWDDNSPPYFKAREW